MNLAKFKRKPLLFLAATLVLAVTAVAITPLPQQSRPLEAQNVQSASEDSSVEAEKPEKAESAATAIKTHTVSEGETLEVIAAKYNIDVDTIRGANPDTDENCLQIGERLTILPQKGIIYTTDMGDTLWSIANAYGVEVAKIITANSKDSEDLSIGEKLFIPGAKPQPKAETVVARADYQVSRSAPARFLWPASGSLTSSFGSRWGRLHAGIDIANDIGTSVRAAMAGRVVSAGWLSGYGYTMVIEHSHGYETLYGHLSEFAVGPGQYVRAGQTVAYMGNTGYSTGPHLHFEVRKNGRLINPSSVLP
ncbi:MAG: peptidoglycan DD-metalloendopeptidase family protein [Veillonellaceae bacterium]|jgi:murein DD-endopeptidase MepM/ murein hydrolase activator NlpD|nr:peptidoglycan DD-metalloendopeptidase family protein [Veillonellaceae bacterium]